MFSRLAYAKTRRLLFAPARTYERPTIASVAPATASTLGGTQLRVVGTGFTMTGDTTVKIDGTAAAVVVQSEFVLFVTAAAHAAGAVSLVVTTPGGSASIGFTYQPATPAPTVSSADPDVGDVSAPHAGLMTITGANFVGGGSFGVTIGGTPALNATFVNATTVTCRPPPKGSGLHTIRVTNNDGQFGDLVNGYRAWTPSEITAVSAYVDSRKGVTSAGGNISQWDDQSANARSFTQGTGANKPTVGTDSFAAGVHSVHCTPQQFVALASTPFLTNGKSYFAVVKWTSTDATPAAPDRSALTIIADNNGAYDAFGAAAGQLQFASYDLAGGTPHHFERGAGLNDGAVRLIGVTVDTTPNEKLYVGNVQQGATNSPAGGYTTVGYRAIGVAQGPNDGWDGDLGAVVAVDGVMSAADIALMNKWARLSFAAVST